MLKINPFQEKIKFLNTEKNEKTTFNHNISTIKF